MFDQGGPLGVERGTLVGGAGEAVPVVGVGVRALLAVKVGVDGHGVGGLELVDEGVGAGPVAARVPPQGFEGSGQVGRRGRGSERGGEGGGGHGRRLCVDYLQTNSSRSSRAETCLY